MLTPEPTVTATRFNVSCLPLDDREAHHWSLRVEYRGRGLWCVTNGFECLAADGSWDHESLPSHRADEWLAAHRFDLDTALALAKEHAPKIVINGWTVADALAKREARDA